MNKLVLISKDSGVTTIRNPAYVEIHTKISNLRQYFSSSYRYKRTLSKEQERERLDLIKKLEKKRAKLQSTLPGSGYRIYYVRYADDFLIGVTGTRKRAEALKLEIKEFLMNKLQLELNMEKTKITDATKGALFLGSILRKLLSRTNSQPQRKKKNKTISGGLNRARIPQGSIRAFVPLERVVKRLETQGICKIQDFKNRKVIPTRKTS